MENFLEKKLRWPSKLTKCLGTKEFDLEKLVWPQQKMQLLKRLRSSLCTSNDGQALWPENNWWGSVGTRVVLLLVSHHWSALVGFFGVHPRCALLSNGYSCQLFENGCFLQKLVALKADLAQFIPEVCVSKQMKFQLETPGWPSQGLSEVPKNTTEGREVCGKD